MAYYYRGSYPLRLDNRLYGALNEYAELNDVAAKNNFIYAQNVMNNRIKCIDDTSLYVPSLYSYPYYYPSSYYNPYIYGAGYRPGYGPYIGSYYPYFY
jgi:inosine/xanthosine triphosphate pyrophosphatase family protein